MKTVNFIEAVNSGKKVNPVEYSQFFYTIKDLMSGDYTLEELVNTKFIIEEKEVTITESQFDEAFAELLKCEHVDIPKCFEDKLKKDLGF